MSADYRHAAVGFPNGAADNAAIFSLPSPNLLMLATEGRYHHDEAVRAGKRCLWRAVPRIGKRPAELKWSPARFMAEALNLTDEPTLPIRDFVFANELDLNTERGDGQDDYADLSNRYALIGGWAYSLIPMLRQALPGTRLHWPAWTPDHHALDYGHLWQPAAGLCDIVDFHAYDSLMNIAGQYSLYRSEFPDKPLALTEWHCKGDLDEERRVLTWMAEMMAVDPLFEAAYFFIYRWHDHPGWWDDSWDLEHSPARLALFRNPPLAVTEPPPVVVPDPPPVIEEPPMPDYPLGIDVSNNNGAINWPAVAADGVSFAVAKLSEGTYFRDGFFAANWAGMKAAGLVRGAYHFAMPSQSGATAEADYFVDAFGLLGTGLEPGDFVALDLEDPAGRGDLSSWTLSWLQRVESRLGFKPLCYTSPGYAQAHGLANRPELAEYGLWCASWGLTTPPPAPAPWNLVAIHQYAVGPDGAVAGVSGEIDLDRYNGDIATLRLYGKPSLADVIASPYNVGQGVLALMAAHGDRPASDELYVSPQYSETFSSSGARYVYLPSLGRTFRYDPAA